MNPPILKDLATDVLESAVAGTGSCAWVLRHQCSQRTREHIAHYLRYLRNVFTQSD